MIADGEAHQVAETVEFHFVHDVVAVAFHGAHREADSGSDLLVAHAAGQHLQDFDFAGGEWRAGNGMLGGGIARIRPLHEIVDHGNSELAGEERLVLLHMAHGAEQFHVRVRFQNVAMGAEAEGLARDILGKMHGEDQHVCFRRGFANLAKSVEAVHFGHGQVQKHHVRLVFLHVVESLDAVGGLMTNFDARLRFEQRANPPANDRVIVGDENPIRFSFDVLFWRQPWVHGQSPW
jgi:hypothetical protein